MSEKPTIVMAMRVKPFVEVVRGSVKDTCSKCGHPVWLAPSSLKRMEKGPCQVVCNECVIPLPLGAQIEPITEQQIAEIEKTVGKEAARRMKEFADGLSGHLAE